MECVFMYLRHGLQSPEVEQSTVSAVAEADTNVRHERPLSAMWRTQC